MRKTIRGRKKGDGRRRERRRSDSSRSHPRRRDGRMHGGEEGEEELWK